MATLLITGTCFWTLEAIFSRLSGIDAVRSGHIWMGSGVPVKESKERYPVEKMEAIRLEWDPTLLPAHDILGVLLNTTSAHLAGWELLDEMSGMRSLIAGIPEQWMKDFQSALEKLKLGLVDKPHTQLTSLVPEWVAASDWDQGYFSCRPRDGFSVSIIEPKLRRIREKFAHLW